MGVASDPVLFLFLSVESILHSLEPRFPDIEKKKFASDYVRKLIPLKSHEFIGMVTRQRKIIL